MWRQRIPRLHDMWKPRCVLPLYSRSAAHWVTPPPPSSSSSSSSFSLHNTVAAAAADVGGEAEGVHHSGSKDGVFHYFPPESEALLCAPVPTLSTTPFATPFLQQACRRITTATQQRTNTTTETDRGTHHFPLSQEPSSVVTTPAISLPRHERPDVNTAPPLHAALVDRYHVSPVFQALGHLWQWRTVRWCGEENGSALRPPNRVGDNSNEDNERSGRRFPPVYVQLPFLLLPTGIVQAQMPIISHAAFLAVKYLALDGGRTKGEVAVGMPAAAAPPSELAERHSPPWSSSLEVPSAIGTLTPHIYGGPSLSPPSSTPTADKKPGGGGGMCNRRDEPKASPPLGHQHGGVSSHSGGGHDGHDGPSYRRECQAMWASAFFDLLDLFHEWEQTSTLSPAGITPSSSSSYSCFSSGGPPSFADQLRQNGWAARIEPSSAIAPQTFSHLQKALRSLPGHRATETSVQYAERCWQAFCAAPLPAAENPCHSTRQSGLHPQSPSGSMDRTTLPLTKVPLSCRNVIGGGLAELIFSIDRYAALVSRGEIPVSAACWALVCDTSSPEVVAHIRHHAVALEVEVMSAVRAHRHATKFALQKDQTLVGKGCNETVSLWNDSTFL